MILNKNKHKLNIVILLFSVLLLISCNNKYLNVDNNKKEINNEDLNFINEDKYNNNEKVNIAGEEFIVCDFDLFDNSKVYMLKSHTNGQMLSIIVKNKNNELIIVDGGRVEDGKYLCDFIKSFGGIVKYWFITHIHDDHFGAIYEIFKNYANEIIVENLCYNFLDFNWYFENVGNDAIFLNLFNEAKDNYIETLSKKNMTMNIHNSLKKGDIFNITDIKVKVMNDVYKINHDPINNSSIVLKFDIDDKKMIVLADLGYYGGERLINEYIDSNELKSDIVVLAHHGQGGVDYKVYENIAPKIALWPTTQYIFESNNSNLQTNMTKKWMRELNITENLLSYKSNFLVE